MNNRSGLWILLIAFCLLAAGCGSSEPQSSRRAQLVGNENIQLKKQIQDKDKEIMRLQNEIQKMEQLAEDEEAKQGETYSRLLEIVADLTKQLEECRAGYPAEP